MAGAPQPQAVLTVGHGTLDGDAFGALVEGAGVGLVVDVRRHPGSRRHPQFGRDRLAAALGERGVGYRWDERLGGRRSAVTGSPNVGLRDRAFQGYADHMATDGFREAVGALLADAAESRLTLMCAETLWWRCHRRLIADHLVLVEGADVEHIMHDGARQPHRPTAAARRDGPRVIYDVGTTPALPT